LKEDGYLMKFLLLTLGVCFLVLGYWLMFLTVKKSYGYYRRNK